MVKNKLAFVIILMIVGAFPIMGFALITSIIDVIFDLNITGNILSAFWLKNPLARILSVAIILLASGLIFSLLYKDMFKDLLNSTDE